MTASQECALCDKEISENNCTKEHVVPNAIGGRKKIKGFICNTCNNKSGSEWESELAKQLNPLSLFFGINRSEGKVPSQIFETTGGYKLQLHPDGSMSPEKPKYIETSTGSITRIDIMARSVSEGERMLKDIKRKHPQINLEAILEKIQITSAYCPDMLKFDLSIGGHKAGRSIVKSALALAVDSGVDPKSCEHARSYLLNENSEACFGYYYENDLLINRPEGIPLHCVSVKGLPDTRQLLGYVEYFGVYRMVVCLSSSYEGQKFSSTYAINPVSGEELETSVDLTFSNDDIQDIYDSKKIPDGAMKDAFEKVISVGMTASVEKERRRVINHAVLYAFSNCGVKEGETLMPEDIEKVLSLIMEKLEPCLLHNINYIKKP